MAEDKRNEGTSAPPDIAAQTTKRLDFKKQSLDDAYAAPANLLEIEVCSPETHGFARTRYTDYEVRMRVSQESCRDRRGVYVTVVSMSSGR